MPIPDPHFSHEKESKSKGKILGLDEPYENAPPKPDGDPWAILLRPEMEADKIQCDAWKDEVQNLLIFAGLFSAVVTAFVIESYKFLQADPNDTIISLLSQIVNGPNTTSTSPISMTTSFVQTPASVRINVFWFLSLILSLATVLVGIIALQWLREHQSYPLFSPKESLAILHMRKKSLEAWYVPQIFAGLPLLLQGALILFLAGLIDFTLPLGTKVAAPVAFIVGLILIFLITTTILPAAQPLFLVNSSFSRDSVPTPCAFKSPQSQAFRALSALCLHFLSSLFPKLYLRENFYPWCPKGLSEGLLHLNPFIYTIQWYNRSWRFFDREWLFLRDAWHQGVLDKDPHLSNHRQLLLGRSAFPYSDIIQCLVNTASEGNEFLVAAFYCFQEVSAFLWNDNDKSILKVMDRHNYYFEQLQREVSESCSIFQFLIHGGEYKYNKFDFSTTPMSSYIAQHRTLFHQDQLCRFLDTLLRWRTSPMLAGYRLEMKLRIMQHLLQNNVKSLTSIDTINIARDLMSDNVTVPSLDISLVKGQSIHLSELTHLLGTLFENLISSQIKQDESQNPLYAHNSMLLILETLANGIVLYSQKSKSARPHDFDSTDFNIIGKEYSSIFRSIANYLGGSIADYLEDEIACSSETSLNPPSLVFYLSAILLKSAFEQMYFQRTTIPPTYSNFRHGLAMLLNSVKRYKDKLGDRRNESIEMSFKGFVLISGGPDGEIDETYRFTETWWATLFRDFDVYAPGGLAAVPSPSSKPLPLKYAPHERTVTDIAPTTPTTFLNTLQVPTTQPPPTSNSQPLLERPNTLTVTVMER